eukprot:GSChrysophyteH1.ASY1.ANO1.1561.1 assembled CDS
MAPKIIIAGAPASGKGTQCEFIKEEFGCVHLSTGDMLRAAVAAGTDLGKEAKGHMDSGGLVPDQLIINIIIARLAEEDCITKGWLLDGFPRTRAQADALQEAGLSCDTFILLNVPDHLLVERVCGRRDDTEEAIMVRVQNFHANVRAIIDAYQRQLVSVDGTRSPSVVWAELRARIKRSFQREVILAMGAPGSGRKDVCLELAKQSDYCLLNVGDALRAATTSHKSADLIMSAMDAGNNVDAATVGEVIRAAFEAEPMKQKFISKRLQSYATDVQPVVDQFRRDGRAYRIDLKDIPVAAAARSAMRILRAATVIPPYERTFAMIKPDAVGAGHIPAILEMHADKAFFPRLKQFMTSGPVLVMILEGADAIKKWRTLLGPTSTQKALTDAPESIRAKFGTDGTQNAAHGSDSSISASREINFWTDPDSLGTNPAITIPIQDTFAMIKPGTADAVYQEITDVVAGHGFQVVQELRTQLSLTQAKMFYAEHASRPFYDELCSYMSSGHVVALHLRREAAISAWRHLIGPTNFKKAQEERPDSIRAKFAVDGTRNAVHGSDSEASAQRELAFFFSVGEIEPALYASKVRTIPSISNADLMLMEAYANYDVEPVMKNLLQQLMVKRPEDVTGFALQQLANMHLKAGKQMPSFDTVAGVPEKLNPIVSPRSQPGSGAM